MGSCTSKSPEKIYEDVEYKNTKIFIPPIKSGKVIKVYDGDTFTIAAKMNDVSKKDVYRFSVRIRHIDCPEIKSSDPDEKEIALFAKNLVTTMIFGKIVHLHNIIYDKYGRLCCDVMYGNINIGSHLIHSGLAVRYEGGKKITPTNWKDYYLLHKLA